MPDAPFIKKDYAALTKSLLGHIASDNGGKTALTDVNEGSVVRTLMEAFARELAVCYEQLDTVYKNAYVDTAAGAGLDNVVALLGVQRRTGSHLEGAVVFSRAQAAPEDIHIPQGTLISGRNVVLFASSEDAVLLRGEKQIEVPVRALEPGGEKVAAGALNVLPRPIAGIELVKNASELILRQRPETDDGLRQRARQLMRLSSTGTVSALEMAARSLGVENVKVVEDLQLAPGVLKLIIGDADVPDELLTRIAERAQDVRPAGVRLDVSLATRVVVQVSAVLELAADLAEHERAAIGLKAAQDVQNYFDNLRVGESVRAAKVRNILSSHIDVVDVRVPQNAYLLNPFTAQPDDGDGQLGYKEQRAKYALANGDVLISNTDRAGLALQALPIRLSFEAPKTKVWLDLTASLLPELQKEPLPVLHEKISNILSAALALLAAQTQEGDAAMISYQMLSRAVESYKLSGMRFTLIHDSDGHAVELDQLQAVDQIGAREQTQLRNVRIKV